MPDLKEKLIAKILGIPGVTEEFWPTESGGFIYFSYKDKDFAHFHAGNELDLRLTKKVIAKEKLKHPDNSVDHPNRSKGSPWIEIRFNSVEELLEIFRLVQLAIRQI